MTTREREVEQDQEYGGIQMNNRNATLTGRDIGCYNTVSGHVTVIHRHGVDAEIPINIANWLRSPSVNYKLIHDEACSMRTPNTVRWLFDMQLYKDWVEGSGEGTRNLQCIGMPGAGKTVLASAIIEDLRSRTHHDDTQTSCVVLYVYFKHDRQSIQTKKLVLANLLSQLVQKQKRPSIPVLSLFKEYTHDLTLIPGPEKTLNVLKSEISSGIITYIVVDALDEFSLDDPSSASALVRDLEKLDANILITSRYDVSFVHSSSKIEVFASAADIELFINQQISSSARLERFIGRSPELRSAILKEVTAKSQGMFLIARFLMGWICGLLKLGEVKNALNNLPHGANEMYELTMKRVGDQQGIFKRLAMSALSWVLLAKRRLKKKELQHVVAFELQEGSGMVYDDDLYEVEDIISACAGLIICVDEEVQFAHFSTQEFLNESCNKYFSDAGVRMTETCLRYLSSIAPLMLIPDHWHTDETYYCWVRDKEYPFARYASSELGHHISDVDGHERLNLRLIDEFFQLSSSQFMTTPFGPPCLNPTGSTYMSTLAYKFLFFANFGLYSIMQRAIDTAEDPFSDLINLNPQVEAPHCVFSPQTPLDFAVRHNNIAMAKLLLKNGAQTTSLCWFDAGYKGETSMITTLLEYGPPLGDDGYIAICGAVEMARPEAVKLLIGGGANIQDMNRPIPTGWTDDPIEPSPSLIHQTARVGSTEVAKILLKEGLKANTNESDGEWMASISPLSYAIYMNNPAMVELYLEEGADAGIRDNRGGLNALHQAICWDRPDMIPILLEKEASLINSLDIQGRTPVSNAARHGQPEMVRRLIEKGADINISDGEGKNPLHYSVSSSCGQLIVPMLLEAGAEINSVDVDGNTPIWLAIEEQRSEWRAPAMAPAKLLIEHGADISVPNRIGAAEGGQFDLIQLLLEKGADPTITKYDGQTPLHAAARNGKANACVVLLDDPRVDVNAKDDSGRTPLLTAIRHGIYPAAVILIENGASTTEFAASYPPSDEVNAKLMRSAAYHGCTRAMELLITMGVSLDGTDMYGTGLVSYAAMGHALGALELLLSQGDVDVHKPNEDQRAPIWFAVGSQTMKLRSNGEEPGLAIVRILLEKGADIYREDVFGNSPLTRARTECIWPGIRELVEQHSHSRLQRGSQIRDDRIHADEAGQDDEVSSQSGSQCGETRDIAGEDEDTEDLLLVGDAQKVREISEEPEQVVVAATTADADEESRLVDGAIDLALDIGESGRIEGKEVDEKLPSLTSQESISDSSRLCIETIDVAEEVLKSEVSDGDGGIDDDVVGLRLEDAEVKRRKSIEEKAGAGAGEDDRQTKSVTAAVKALLLRNRPFNRKHQT